MSQPISQILSYNGCEITLNSSFSHYEYKKTDLKIELIREINRKLSGIYSFCNARGCDGSRLYADGASLVVSNGELIYLNDSWSLEDVDVQNITVDLRSIRQKRQVDKNIGLQTQITPKLQVININIDLCEQSGRQNQLDVKQNLLQVDYFPQASALYLWDYFRRSKLSSIFLALSGGADSASTACIVYNMCIHVFDHIQKFPNSHTLQELRRIVQNEQYIPSSAKEIVNKIFYTCYMPTDNSSEKTLQNAQNLSFEINAQFKVFNIQTQFDEMRKQIKEQLNLDLQFKTQGGSYSQDIQLQNIQARLRMVAQYAISSQINKERPALVLSSANLDESLVGYFTKYDCSSADLNLIGSLDKLSVKKYLIYNQQHNKLKSIEDILSIQPSAELVPKQYKENEEIIQSDESEIGLTYSQLCEMGQLRKREQCGPLSMFLALIQKNQDRKQVAKDVKRFFTLYSKNRHKQTVLTPSFYNDNYSNDDNRFDLRQIIYNTNWDFQFKQIDNIVNAEIKL